MKNKEYQVQEILDYRNRRGVREYQIKWKGYPLDECTWEPQQNLTSCLDMLHDFKVEVGLEFEEEDNRDYLQVNKKIRGSAVKKNSEDVSSKKLNFLKGNEKKELSKSIEKKKPLKQKESFVFEEETTTNERSEEPQRFFDKKQKKTTKSETFEVIQMMAAQNDDIFFQVQIGSEKKIMARGELVKKNVLAILGFYERYCQIFPQSMWV